MKPVPIRYTADSSLVIDDISWNRAFLELAVKADPDDALSFSFANIRFLRSTIKYDDTYCGDTVDIPAEMIDEFSVSPDSYEDGRYRFSLNLAIINGGSFMNNGKWYLAARKPGDETVILCCISEAQAHRLEDLSKVFRYGYYRYAYTVSFSTQCFDSANLIPVIISEFMIQNDSWEDSYVVRERPDLKSRLRCLKKKTKIAVLQLLYNILEKISRKNGKNILLMSETKPYLWGNLKYIDDRIRERSLDKVFKVSYSFRIAVGKNNNARSWFRTIRLLAAQDFIFVDDYAPIFGFLELSPRTKLIQVWHAGVGFKSVGYCRFGLIGSPYPSASCHRKYDYVVTGSEYLSEVYSEVFGQPMDHMLPLGMARLDGFLDQDVMDEKIRAFYADHPELEKKKIILFCPTFRGQGQKQAFYDYGRLDFGRIYDFCGDEYVWAFKMHPFVKKAPPIPEQYRDRIIDLGSVKNINDLYYVTDIMITDYSSAYYEYALLRRPILFYTYDRDMYEITRGVHRSILDTAPGKVCDSFDELMKALEDKDYETEKTIRFSEEIFGGYDGRACDRIIDTILLGGKNDERSDV